MEQLINHPGALDREMQSSLSPQEALSWLFEGHKRYKADSPKSRDRNALFEGAKQGQFPYAAILGCIDSRAPIERIFDAQSGDLFVARVAGNVINNDVIGSLEYACKYAGTPVILVLGHTSCGAVAAAWNGVEDGHITDLLASIKPAVNNTKSRVGEEANTANLNTCSAENVALMCQGLTEESPILAGLVNEGKVAIAGGVYNVETGDIQMVVNPF